MEQGGMRIAPDTPRKSSSVHGGGSINVEMFWFESRCVLKPSRDSDEMGAVVEVNEVLLKRN